MTVGPGAADAPVARRPATTRSWDVADLRARTCGSEPETVVSLDLTAGCSRAIPAVEPAVRDGGTTAAAPYRPVGIPHRGRTTSRPAPRASANSNPWTSAGSVDSLPSNTATTGRSRGIGWPGIPRHTATEEYARATTPVVVGPVRLSPNAVWAPTTSIRARRLRSTRTAVADPMAISMSGSATAGAAQVPMINAVRRTATAASGSARRGPWNHGRAPAACRCPGIGRTCTTSSGACKAPAIYAAQRAAFNDTDEPSVPRTTGGMRSPPERSSMATDSPVLDTTRDCPVFA